MPDDDLAQACRELTAWMVVAKCLIHQRDVRPTARASGKPGSRPPWNAAVAGPLLDAHEGVRRLETALRIEVAGASHLRRGGSDGNTRAALEAIPGLAAGAERDSQREAAHQVSRWSVALRQLPATDDLPKWERLRLSPGDGLPPKCPHCETFSLRVALASGVVACFFPGCEDADGRRPRARLDVNRVDGSAVLVWNDGKVQ